MRLPILLFSALAVLGLMMAPATASAQIPPPPPGVEDAASLHADNLSWTRARLKPHGIVIDLPALPDTSARETYLVDGADFSVSIEVQPASGTLGPETLWSIAQKLPEGYRMIAVKPVTQDGVAGVERTVVSEDGYSLSERLYFYRNSLYTVLYLADPGGALEPNAGRLHNSLRFVDASGT